MKQDIRTHEADLSLVIKFLDYADCADASYSLLEHIFKGEIKYKFCLRIQTMLIKRFWQFEGQNLHCHIMNVSLDV